ncbi:MULTISPECIES: DUF3019 domain-containing protein [Shewanella]|uniref:DUF3019 domain-containing protein n=1 Tax=Shewanella TaxID=22 RepID=UPI001C660F34|nr:MULTISPECIES: DUF3019 domain-containing protein [Shewanella]QYJ83213.1 DUF3019 domain-containing protein [Shewanella aegiceratis]QYJ94580.1 DUF3019 domain-containing protein [Shewanella spartinae]QYJ98432.1 DUF3019 domain-containing protein [Shewanella alkalitolerans]
MPSNAIKLIQCMLLLALATSFYCQANSTQVNIKPKTCAVLEAGTPCHMTLKISYKLEALEQTCIWIALKEAPEQCFDRLSVDHLLELTLTKDTQVLIKDLNNKVLDEVTIQIATYQPVNTRKRRGLNWNLL